MVIPHDLVGWFPPPFLLSLNHKIPNVIVPTFYYLAFSDLVLSNRFGTLGFLTCGFLICGITEAFFKGNHTLNHDLLISLRWGGRESSLRHSLCWGTPETYWSPQRSVWRPLACPLHSWQKWLTFTRLTPCPYDTNTLTNVTPLTF